MSLSVYLTYFKEKHFETLGHPYLVTWGKDNKIIKEITQAYGPKRTIKMIHKFFQNLKQDQFLKKTGATIGVFKSQIPKLLMQLSEDDTKEGIGKL